MNDDSDYENANDRNYGHTKKSLIRTENCYRLPQQHSTCQHHELSGSSDDDDDNECEIPLTSTEPTTNAPTTSRISSTNETTTSNRNRLPYEIPREYDEDFLISRVIGLVRNVDDENATMHLVGSPSSSTTLISSGKSTTTTASCDGHDNYQVLNDDFDDNIGHEQICCLTDWSSSDEETSFYNDKTNVLTSTIDVECQLAGSEYFNSNQGGYSFLLSNDA